MGGNSPPRPYACHCKKNINGSVKCSADLQGGARLAFRNADSSVSGAPAGLRQLRASITRIRCMKIKKTYLPRRGWGSQQSQSPRWRIAPELPRPTLRTSSMKPYRISCATHNNTLRHAVRAEVLGGDLALEGPHTRRAECDRKLSPCGRRKTCNIEITHSSKQMKARKSSGTVGCGERGHWRHHEKQTTELASCTTLTLELRD